MEANEGILLRVELSNTERWLFKLYLSPHNPLFIPRYLGL